MRRLAVGFTGVLFLCGVARAQFDLEESHSTASLRGIDSVGVGVAWASGSGGTVLRTEDGGFLWQTCPVPGGADKLDFRGVRGFDAQTALVMSSGPGPLSKVYRTTDGCQTWTLVLDDPDAEGFFDAIWFRDATTGYLLGDPVDGRFVVYGTTDGGVHWTRVDSAGLAAAAPGIGAFAASNSSIGAEFVFATGGPGGPFVYTAHVEGTRMGPGGTRRLDLQHGPSFEHVKVPMAGATESAGIFSLARCGNGLVAVGGEYTKPDVRTGTAAYFNQHGGGWLPAKTLPGGYRSSVGYDTTAGVCVAVGPTGMDMSKDGGVNWRPVSGETTAGWNAVSLPFVVGAKGQIGKLRDGALQ